MTTYATYEADHYQQAERLLNQVRNGHYLEQGAYSAPDRMVAVAQVDATLALAAAVADLITLLRSE